MNTHEALPFYQPAPGGRRGILGWILSTNHKRIGILYMVSVLAFFFAGVVLGLLMRLELIAPGATIMGPQTYNAMFTLHGIIMVFLVVIPAVPVIFGNLFLPVLIGAPDMALPRLNLASWYLYIIGAVLAFISLYTGGGPIDTGWTFYVPYSLRTTVNVPLAVFAVFVLGVSSILTGINIVTTVHQLRAPGMSFNRMPLSVWSFYATAWVQIVATPVIGITLVLILLERLFGVGVFDPAKGGDPILYQHLFWIYSHPAVYIMVLPAMGVISDIFPTFAHKDIFGYRAIAWSSLGIASVGSLVWGHHMFVSGESDFANIVFSFFTYLVAVPSAIKIFNWVSTLYKGSITVEPPFLYALCFIVLFSVGGISGLTQGALGPNVHVHDTYYVVAHLHYVIFGGMGFGMFAAFHYWYPKITGRMYDKRHAALACLILFVGFSLLYFPMYVLGLEGMPRRYFDYLPRYATLHVLSTVGSWILAVGLVLMFGNLIRSLFRGPKAEADPWGGTTLEWQLPSPMPLHSFEEPPTITRGPYRREAKEGGHG